MSSSSLRHLHMGCGESLMAAWPSLKKTGPKSGQAKQIPDATKQPARKQKGKRAC